ncbi:MAG: hypothetical protein KAW46_00270 [candidate division Zixibacteria bacterium]|nr:hypothetical protein [candidate division Zixibacteria bacterium]
MTVYKSKKSHSMKWLVAFIIFALAMTITWSDVYGAEISSVMKIHQAKVAHVSFARSRFYPNWYPGFLKPQRTILASTFLTQAATVDGITESDNLMEPSSTNILEIDRTVLIEIS